MALPDLDQPELERERRDDDAVTRRRGGASALGRSAGVRWVVLGVLLVVIVASLGYVGTRVARDGTGSGWGRVTSAFSGDDSLQTERDAAMSQARQFALRMNTYSPDMLDAKSKQMPSYRTSVEEVITAKFRADFEKDVPLVEATVSQLGVKRAAQVYLTGVGAIDDDTATVLVAGSFTNSYPKKKGSSTYVAAEPEPFRFEVTMVKTGGTWLTDNFTPVEGTQTGAAAGGTGGAGTTGGGQ